MIQKLFIFSAYGDKTKKFGYYKFEKGKTEKLIYDDLLINRLAKAKDANAFIYVKQDYHVSPTLYATDDFISEKIIVSTNPQQQNYYWGKSELLSFTNTKGRNCRERFSILLITRRGKNIR